MIADRESTGQHRASFRHLRQGGEVELTLPHLHHILLEILLRSIRTWCCLTILRTLSDKVSGPSTLEA